MGNGLGIPPAGSADSGGLAIRRSGGSWEPAPGEAAQPGLEPAGTLQGFKVTDKPLMCFAD